MKAPPRGGTEGGRAGVRGGGSGGGSALWRGLGTSRSRSALGLRAPPPTSEERLSELCWDLSSTQRVPVLRAHEW